MHKKSIYKELFIDIPSSLSFKNYLEKKGIK